MGLTEKANPCARLRRNKETPRDFYAGQIVWDAVYAEAPPELKDAMDLAYLTGQRPADVLKASTADLNNGFLMVGQGKTEKRLRIRLHDGTDASSLSHFLDALLERKAMAGIRSSSLITNQTGLRMSYAMLRNRWLKPGRKQPRRQQPKVMQRLPPQSASSNFATSDQKPPAK